MLRDAAPRPQDDEQPVVLAAGTTANHVTGAVTDTVVLQVGQIASLVMNHAPGPTREPDQAGGQTPSRRPRTVRLLHLGAVAIVLCVVGSMFAVAPLVVGERFCDRPYRVKDPILTRYQELTEQSLGLGCPTAEQTATPGRRGERMRFTDDSDGNERWIYWSPETGANPIWGDIGEKWLSSEQTRLGFPTSAEENWEKEKTKYQRFEHGTLYWRPEPPKSVYAVLKDDIGDQWDRDHGRYGFPVSDEVPDGSGCFQAFENDVLRSEHPCTAS